jgi:hypothetical protein
VFAEDTCAGRLSYTPENRLQVRVQLNALATLTDGLPVDFQVVHQQRVAETHCIVHNGWSDPTAVCEAFVVHKCVGTNEDYLPVDAKSAW